MSRRRGFTLIELLVVISIISVLMAVLMPALSRVRDQGRMTVCRSNLRNYAMIGRLYADDNNYQFPYSFGWLYSKNNGTGCTWHDKSKNLDLHPEWAGVMWPYLKGQKINLCPTFNTVARQMSCYICKGATIGIDPQYGYTMNSYLNGDAWNSVPAQYQPKIKELKTEAQVAEPAAPSTLRRRTVGPFPGSAPRASTTTTCVRLPTARRTASGRSTSRRAAI